MLHPTINVENPEAEVDMSVIVAGEKQAMDVNIIGVQTWFGLGCARCLQASGATVGFTS